MGSRLQSKQTFILGAFILTLAGLFSRFAGFFYRIFLSNQLGAEGMGIYQLIFPVYGICISLCCSSIQTALSRFIAGEHQRDGSGKSRAYFGCGLTLSLSLALFSSMALYFLSETISLHILGDIRCAPLLQMMALVVPVCSVHSCIMGCCYGLQKTTVPALSQVIEQTIRMGSVFFIYQYTQNRQLEFQVIHAVYGLIIGEVGALVFSLLAFGPLWAALTAPRLIQRSAVMSGLLRLVIPMTANRLCLSFLQSGEAILIPARLRLYGLTQAEALSLFGILNGMALPFILFPSTLINSLAVMLLPEVAKAQAAGNNRRLQSASGLSIHLSLIIGILCLGVFRYFGNALGIVVFDNETAGGFITQMSFLCPFLYLSVTLGSIINGLGRTEITFFHNLISLALRLGTVFFAVPAIGISAYFYGLLASEILLTGLHLSFLVRTTGLKLNLVESVLKPSLTLVPVAFLTTSLNHFLQTKTHLPELMCYLLTGAWFVFSFLGIVYLWRETVSPKTTC